MTEPLLSTVLISARKLTLAYQRLHDPLPCPIAMEPDPRRGWYGKPARPSGILTAAGQLLKKKIEIFSAPPMGVENPIAAFVCNYHDHADIYISAAQNYCWRRFLVAKELAHLLTCNELNRTPITPFDVSSLLSDLINNVHPEGNPILQAESLAYFAAIEILLPKEFAEDASRRLAGGESILDLSYAYRMPRKAMELRLTDSNAQGLFESVYNTHRFKTLGFNPFNG